MNATGFYNIILVPVIAMLFFVHFNFKPNKLLTTVNEYLLFRKYFFNKKINVPVNKKVACSFFYFFTVAFICVPNHAFWQDLVYWSHWNSISDFIGYILTFLILLLIIRLIYEFLIIPYLYKRSIQNTYQKNISYMDNPIYQGTANNMASDFKFCSQCGTRYPVNDTVCPKCGKN